MTVRRHSPRNDRRSRFARLRGERGAAAVEFALVVPVLLLLLLGIVEFSRAYQSEAALSAAAREGARVMALENDRAAARIAVEAAVEADTSGLTLKKIDVPSDPCPEGASDREVTVTVTYHQSFAIGLFDFDGVDLTGKAVMRCGG